jgi:23S rRNA (cytosine1962-C5)-methyltransferase
VSDPSSREPQLRLRLLPGPEAAVREGHPWVYAEGVGTLNRTGKTGEFAVLYDRRDRFMGIGLYDAESPIRVRLLHVGKPRLLDGAWWRERLDRALERRERLFDTTTTGYRLLNGESDGWPALVLDRYDATLVLKLYTAAWFSRLDMLLELLRDALPHERVVLRLSRNLSQEPQKNGQVISGAPLDGPVLFAENGLRFEADVLKGQKTGFFLDQRENRMRVETLAANREVLNAFSFSGGFSLYAARGGAAAVTDVDLSAYALESAGWNFELNRAVPAVRACRHERVQADVFEWLRDSPERQWDLVILDPPSLARREAEREHALQAYRKLAAQGIRRLRRRGILVSASCSAHVPAEAFFSAVRQTAMKSGRRFREIASTGHPPDHPAAFPEARYLKCLFLKLD